MIGSDDDVRLLAQAATWESAELSSQEIGLIAKEHGLDLATAVLYQRICQRPATAAFLSRAKAWNGFPDPQISIGVVPGAFHQEHRNTGAEGDRILAIARALGLSAEVIPTAGFGRLSENARIIHQWLNARRGSRVALISLSKGGTDVKEALAQPVAEEAFGHVVSWVSLSGLVQGTPLIDWLRRRPWRWCAVRAALWWRGHPRETLFDLRHGPKGGLGSWPVLPSHLLAVHVCGFPLRRHLAHPWAARAYARLAPLGPNDGGGNLLADALDYPGIVCPVWGVDHYLSPRWDATPLLTGIVATALAPRQASLSAIHPTPAPASKSKA